VARTLRYEFQLSTSNVFRDSGIVYSNTQVKAPAIAVPLALPWITGKPYALYARLRAVTQIGTTPWTAPYGFNMRWPNVPEPMSSFPGLLRWTPVAGATRYQVWLNEARKVITTSTNVADEREYYTFHSASRWTSSVRWRVRAVRELYGTAGNALPAASYGPWSPIYTAVNAPFPVGPLTLAATVSDSVTDETEAKDAHRLMPGFVFGGMSTYISPAPELYRVYAFTDSDCVNTVFRGSAVGSPAFAPRLSGMLELPSSRDGIASARNKYLRDLEDEPVKELTMDGSVITPNENATVETEAPADDGESGEGEAAAEAAPAADAPAAVPPVDLWDTEWPQGGYYWTVVPVVAEEPEPFETELATSAAVGTTTIQLEDATGLEAGNELELGMSPPEVVTVKTVSGTTITLEAPLTGPHAAGEEVARSADTIHYQDAELPQDACAEGRVLRFGKMSEPAVAVAGAPLISGLSMNGRLVSASRTQAVFSGSPVAAWNPAAGAHAYQVQWSKRAEPFQPAAKAIQTFATSAVLPLAPGRWHYRVRGLNLSLPKGAQPLSWSDPVKVVVAKPRFTVVSK
jgi:hypothetical protein